MKNIITKIMCAVLVFACAASFVGCGASAEVPDGYKLASNDSCDFDFIVPDSWIVSLSDGTVAAYCSSTDPSSISVMPGELEYANSTIDDWWAEYKTDFETVYSEFTVIEEKDASLDGVEGKCYTFTGKMGENTYRFEITAVLKHSRLYMMTFTSTPELYENHTEALASVKENFKFH